MNNEPVAWMFQGAFDISTYVSIDKPNPDIYPNPIPLYTHPVKELHLSLQKSKQTGELLAVTYTDDEHRIVEVLWQRPPELTDEEINKIYLEKYDGHMGFLSPDEVREFARAILRKAQEK